jgi:uncharacterized protein YjbI with pentapeptide repeats
MRRRWNIFYEGTGFHGKTLWEWMKLLMVPLVVGILAAWFQVTTNNAAQEREDSRAALQLKLTEDLEKLQQDREDERARLQREGDDQRARQGALQLYIQDISELLLREKLAESPSLPATEQGQQAQQVDVRQVLVRQIARAHTLATVGRLDDVRKGVLLQFLYDVNLLSWVDCGVPIVPPPQSRQECRIIPRPINVHSADLRNTVLVNIFLHRVDLRGANLSGANLSLSTLDSANLNYANLSGANLSDAHMMGAVLGTTDLRDADLSNADLRGAWLSGTPDAANDFERGIFGGSPYRGANLSGANLSGADLSCLDLGTEVRTPWTLALSSIFGLRCTNLRGATGWTNEQLAQAKSLVGAIMPDGTKMTEEAWEEFKRRYR